MPAEAKTVIDRFREAVSENNWEKALSYCTRKTQSRARQYGPEEYIARFVPIAKLQVEPKYKFWTHGQDRLGGEYNYFGCFLHLLDGPDGETVNWQWWLDRTAHGWLIDLPDVPVDRWIEEEIDRSRRLKEKHEAMWRALEPKLKGLRTQLTALQEEYQLGQPMTFRLELINEGEYELSYDSQQVAVNASMIIKDENGRVMPYTAGPSQTGGSIKPIKPGASVVLFESLDVAKQYEIKEPGKYQVQFKGRGLTIEDAIGLHNGVARRTFPSNTVEIEIKP